MSYDPDDPRLTAYALGELEGDEKAAVESLLTDHPDARATVEEVRALARLLTDKLHAEPAAGLSADQHKAIAAELDRPVAAVPFRPQWTRLALAATVLVAAGAAALAWINRNPSSEPLAIAMDTGAAAPAAEPTSAPRPPTADAPEQAAPATELAKAVAPVERSVGELLGKKVTPGQLESNTFAFSTAPAARGVNPAPRAGDEALLAPMAGPQPQPADLYSAQANQAAPAGAVQLGFVAPAPPATALSASGGSQSTAGGLAAGGAGGMAGQGIGGQQAGRFDQPGRARQFYRESDQRQAGASQAGQPGESRLSIEGLKPGQDQAPQSGQQNGQERSLALGVRDLKAANRPSAPDAADLATRHEPKDVAAILSDGTVESKSEEKPALTPSNPTPELKQSVEDLARLDDRQVDKLEQLGEQTRLAEEAEVVREEIAPPVADLDAAAAAPIDRERFTPIVENEFEAVTPGDTFSTFSIDVDTAGYANVRRYLTQNLWPPADAVRIEEMVNYFDYDYAPPASDAEAPFAVHTEVVRCPWQPDHHLLRVGLKGKEIDFAQRKPSNLVFLVDVSGSMNEPDKLPLVKAGLRMLVEQLGENDRIAMTVYAGAAGQVLPSTQGHHKREILEAIDRLEAGGSTNGGAGIELAYNVAVQNFIPGGVNRVILATDGDFNTGLTGADNVAKLAAEKAKTGVFLSVLGVGQGNLQDETMEKVADQGNGSYHYLDTLMEARKVLVEQVGGTLMTIAKDVKIQVDFNPAKVREFRLIGYENRNLADADFTNDAKDAGEIGSGHTVTALYELVPVGQAGPVLAGAEVKAQSRYVKPAEVDRDAETSKELLTVRLRYKAPDGHESRPLEHPVADDVKDLGHASSDTKFTAAVAEFGMLLRGSRFAGQATLDAALELAQANLGNDPNGRRAECVGLIEKARTLYAQQSPPPARNATPR